eukprot:Skav211850  [mRNA]  locus=scaffold1622:6900:9179:+ [translate_table: standard]
MPDAVAKALRSFPSATAPGPSSLRAQHLLEACWPGGRDSLLVQLAGVICLLASGLACDTAAPLLAGANLVAIPKQQGGVRPIAIGEVLRRLTGKCLMELVRQDARQMLFPAQVGVSVPAGSELAVHCVRAWHARHAGVKGKVLVNLDFQNAFNTVSRQEVLSATRANFPSLTRWVRWCYGGPTTLQFGGTALQSAAGVQQGDPLGPLLFAAALQPLATELREGPLDLALFYLDDGVLAGDVAAVGAAVAHVQQRAASLGLRLNLSKCEVVVPGADAAADLSPALPAAMLWDTAGSDKVFHNFEFLGAAVGDASFVASHTASRVDKTTALLEAIAEFEDPQVALRLLRACAGHSRLLHSMRCNPPLPQHPALEHFDSLVRDCFSSFTGLHLDQSQWLQATRGLAHAGLGLRATSIDAPAAYLASVGGCAQHCLALDPCFGNAAVSPPVVGALTACNQKVAVPLTVEAALVQRQRALVAQVDLDAWTLQMDAANPCRKALLMSNAQPGGRAFLAAVPAMRKRMEPALFIAELRHRLGVPDAPADGWCPRCDGILDTFSLHAAVCIAGSERVQRHHALRDLLCTWADRTGLQPEKERPGLLLPQPPEDTAMARRRPADIFAPSFSGKPTAFDLAVTGFQWQASLTEAARHGGAAAAAYSAVKKAHLDTESQCQQQGVNFLPLVVETTGPWDPAGARILKSFARAAAAREQADPAGLFAELLQETSVLVRGFRGRAALQHRGGAALTDAPSHAATMAAVVLRS